MSPQATGALARAADAQRARVEALKLETPGYRLRARLGPVRPAGRLERALRRGAASDPLRLMCALPRVEPAPATLARLYQTAGAAALSVADELERARGEAAWLGEVKAACALPILLDDLVVDEYQLLAAAVRGADGVLLIAALCSDVRLQVLASGARLLGLDPLVEVHDGDELKRALKAGATLLGLGSRDPTTAAAGPVAATTLSPLVPPLVTAVAWSETLRAGDLEGLRATRCDAVLAGEGLLAGPDRANTLAALAAAARGG
jgi:indole-3-glycerol phosphate synthase